MAKNVVLTMLPLSKLFWADQLTSRFEILEFPAKEERAAFLKENGSRVEGLVTTAGVQVSNDLVDALPNLKVISTFSVGLDHIDLEHAKSRRIEVGHTPEVLNSAVADTALALILATSRRICEADRFVREGRWESEMFPLGVSLEEKKCGIVGLGGIGRAIAKRAEAFGMTICYQGPHKKSDVSYKYYADVESLAGDVDFLVLSLPGGAATKHLINEKVLNALGPKGILINVARGSVVDEKALVHALKTNSILAAGLDVFEKEPHVPVELRNLENVVLLPHLASGTIETRTKMANLVIANLSAAFGGQPLLTPAFKL